jgi:hypothetical protein
MSENPMLLNHAFETLQSLNDVPFNKAHLGNCGRLDFAWFSWIACVKKQFLVFLADISLHTTLTCVQIHLMPPVFKYERGRIMTRKNKIKYPKDIYSY